MSLYQAALTSDPRFRAAEANYQALQQRLPEARAALLPQLDARASSSRNSEDTTTDQTIFTQPAGSIGYRSGQYSLNLTQPLLNTAALAGIRQANAEIRQAEAEHTAARHELMLRLAEAYLQILLAHDTLSLAAAEKETLTKSLDAARAKHQEGVASLTEVEDARARMQVAIAQEIETANQLEDRQQALREIIGRIPDRLASLGDDIPLLTPDPPEVDRWAEAALTQNLTVRAAAEAVTVAREDIARNEAAHAPTIDIVGSTSRIDDSESISGPGVRTDRKSIGLQLNLPLFQGGIVLARTREAEFRHDAALQELEARRRNAERSARTAFREVRGAQARSEALKQAVGAGETVLNAKTEGQRAGLYHTIDVLDATRDLYRAKRDYAEARYGYLLAFLRLKQSAGTLNEDDLSAINKWLR
ncbi:MAG: TolC family outer membrane protein [Gammaproteobacteria bacterium]|nr:TolC family outer membrane protein [Gammaproteobacteria bacterium]